MTTRAWWQDMVCYQVYLRSFRDGNGDGLGDIPGVIERLDHLAALGVDAVWLSPFYRSPQVDAGYDVSDPTSVEPRYGTEDDVRRLVAHAHQRGLRVLAEVIPNHVSADHEWFVGAIAGDDELRKRFVFRSSSDGGPPNNWTSVFGGPAWTQAPDGEWYLHLFDPSQPDLNWENPAVPEEFERVVRHWLGLGIDGFRVDVAHGLAKPEGLPDLDFTPDVQRTNQPGDIRFNDPGVHQHLQRLRRVADEFSDAVLLGEVWTASAERLRHYMEPGQLHLLFSFELLEASWGAEAFAHAISDVDAAQGDKATWVLSNHDVDRHATRYGGGARGRERARSAALVQLALPGVAVIYQGDELGLETVDLPDEVLQDPTWERSGHQNRGRDGVRVPLPWTEDAPGHGFTETTPWLPMPEWRDVSVAAQSGDPRSHLSLYRTALRLRRAWAGRTLSGVSHVNDVLTVDLELPGHTSGSLRVVVNMSESDAEIDAAAVTLLSSSPLTRPDLLAPDQSVWQHLTGRRA